MQRKMLDNYKGFMLEKTWHEYPDGSKHDVMFYAYLNDKHSAVYHSKSLKTLKQKIDNRRR